MSGLKNRRQACLGSVLEHIGWIDQSWQPPWSKETTNQLFYAERTLWGSPNIPRPKMNGSWDTYGWHFAHEMLSGPVCKNTIDGQVHPDCEADVLLETASRTTMLFQRKGKSGSPVETKIISSFFSMLPVQELLTIFSLRLSSNPQFLKVSWSKNPNVSRSS